MMERDPSGTPLRARLRFPFWVVLALPVACAPLFLWLAMRERVPPERLEHQWMYRPSREFPIKDGDWVVPGGDLGYVAFGDAKTPHTMGEFYYRVVYSLKREGVLECHIHTGIGSRVDSKQAPPGLSARIPVLLQKLPASVQPVDPRNCAVVAFAVNGRWFVRSYPFPGPKELSDLMNALSPSAAPTGNATE
jgi:hypothetical protein